MRLSNHISHLRDLRCDCRSGKVYSINLSSAVGQGRGAGGGAPGRLRCVWTMKPARRTRSFHRRKAARPREENLW